MTNAPRPRRCRDLLRHLAEYMEGGLPPALQSDMEAHLGACPDCREVVRRLQDSVARCRQTSPCVDRKCLEKAVKAAREELRRRGLITD